MSKNDMIRGYPIEGRRRTVPPVLRHLGQVSHLIAEQLRNPVTGIVSTAQILQQQTDSNDPRSEEYAFILQEAARLNRTLENLTSLVPSRTASSLPSLISEEVEVAIGRVSSVAKQRKVHVDFHAEANNPPALVDSELLQIALHNLLINALEAMEQGGIVTVEVRLLSELEEIEIAIRDTGEGVPADQLDLVFEPLFSTKSDGVGLGLTVARDLVERQRGRVFLESENETGSVVYVRLPVSELSVTQTDM